MALQDSEVFDLRLFDSDDDAEDLEYKNILNSVAIQSATPAQAAARIDDWVVTETNKRYDKFKQRNPPFKLSEEEKHSLYLEGPNPSRQIEMIIGAIARLCSAYPPNHYGQNSLIQLVQVLKELPKHEVHDISHDDESNEPGFEKKTLLWQFGTPSADFLAQKFQREAEEFAYPFSDVEVANSEVQRRWRNLQSFIARLTTLDLINCSITSALLYILPSHHVHPDLEKRSEGGPRRIAGDLIAASQWLEPQQARQWVYNECKSAGEGDRMSHVWSMSVWNDLKTQLSFFGSDERFSQQTQDLARSLRQKMDAQE